MFKNVKKEIPLETVFGLLRERWEELSEPNQELIFCLLQRMGKFDFRIAESAGIVHGWEGIFAPNHSKVTTSKEKCLSRPVEELSYLKKRKPLTSREAIALIFELLSEDEDSVVDRRAIFLTGAESFSARIALCIEKGVDKQGVVFYTIRPFPENIVPAGTTVYFGAVEE